MGVIRILSGTIFCLVAVLLVILFMTLGSLISDISELLSLEIYQIIFYLTMHPYSSAMLGLWIVLIALVIGALIGGLIARSTKGGIAVGFLALAILFMLYLGITWNFNFNAMISYWTLLDTSIYLDIIISFIILVSLGAIGGKLTSSIRD
ncbi:MAG: hypothetical protein ACFFD2_07565 [Promethearchaeota archaeon]